MIMAESKNGKSQRNRDPYRNQAIVAARELGYGKKTILAIKAAKDDAEIDRIMRARRKEKFGD